MTWELAVYWVLVLAAGTALVDVVPLDWRLTERLAGALLAGVVASSLLSLALALWWGVGPVAALVAPGALLVVAGGVRGRSWSRRLSLGPRPWGNWLTKEWRRADTKAGLVVTVLLGAAFYIIFTRALVETGGSITASYPTVWSDWSVHASYAQSFLLGHNLPPNDSLESATGLRYPFLPDFQSALLAGLGQNIWGALAVPSWLISWSAGVLVWQLALRVTRRNSAASVALLLALLGGGLGFVGLYGDGCQQLAHTDPGFSASSCTSLTLQTPGAAAAFVAHLPVELTHLPRSYDGQDQTNPPVADLQWYEPLLAFWLPQRDFEYGMGLVALLSLLLWEAYRGRRRQLLVAAGVGAAALPWFNPFGYLVVGLVGLWWLGRQRWWRGLGLFLLPFLVLGLPRILYVVTGPHGQLASPVGANLYPQLDVGWLAHAVTSCTAAQFNGGSLCGALYLAGASPLTAVSYLAQNLIQPAVWAETAGFWLANTGIFTLLAAAVLIVLRAPSRVRAELRELELIRFWAPFWILFLIGNLVITQPWNWDNTKLLDYWYVGAAIPVAWLICTLGGRGWWRIPATLAVLSLVLSGLLSMDMALTGQSSLSQAATTPTELGFAGVQEEAVAQAVLQRTSPSAIFLTEGQPNEPVSVLAGRTVVLAYDGWLWSYGQPLRQRLRAVDAIYAGCTAQGNCAVGRLLRAYDVSYIEFEPGDYNHITTNESWYEAQHLPVVVQTQSYLILDVRRLWSR
ncbi:MAG TPA: hypothetical protein VMV23_13130 [Candidatus Nanopelagicaceae bacterium]|nr:hypothetical protein [Candidatus Nanopelagicaceae bacterium]